MEILWVLFFLGGGGGWGGGGHHNIRLDLGSFLCILGSFLQVKIQNVDILRGF